MRYLVYLLFLLACLSCFSQLAPVNAVAQCCSYTVSGRVWNDLDEDGIIDTGEPPLEGWVVEAFNVTESFLVATAITDSNGTYSFDTPVGCLDQDAGFGLVLQSDWRQVFPADPSFHLYESMTGCDGVFGDVNFAVAPGPCEPHAQTWTVNEFHLGDFNGIVTTAGGLELTPDPTTLGSAWIANSDGTVSRVDTETGKEIASYFTGPPKDENGLYTYDGSYSYLNPSRTAVDIDGNCWVVNRAHGYKTSVTQILATGGIDRNNNGRIDTSVDFSGNGIVEIGEMYRWGDDERVVRHYVLAEGRDDAIGRALALDKDGYLWIGFWNENRVDKLAPDLSTATFVPDLTPEIAPILASVDTPNRTPYGLALSPNGLLYLATYSEYVLEIDPGDGVSPPTVSQILHHDGRKNYGIAVDQDCVVWAATMDRCMRWDPSLGTGASAWNFSTSGASGRGFGITIDFKGEIWMSLAGGEIARYQPTTTPTWLANYPTGLSRDPRGVGVASDGNIIMVDKRSPYWVKIDSDTGALIPLSPRRVGPTPYTYSDFTGSLQGLVSQQQGVWSAVSDGGNADMIWTTLDWSENTPPGTEIEIFYRVSDSLGGLSSLNWVATASPGDLSPPVAGRFMEVAARLTREIDCDAPWMTPVLVELSAEADCDSCEIGPCTPIVAPCTSTAGAVVEYPTPTIEVGECDAPHPVICDWPSGSHFPIGTTIVTCSTTTNGGEVLSCEFPVTVTDTCQQDLGCCCFDVDGGMTASFEMTETQCRNLSGIWLGGSPPCTGGCDINCARPPRDLQAWFPLDTAVGDATPNLANPGLPGILSGTPTVVPGQWVTSSYHFAESDAADKITVADDPSLDAGVDDLTIDLWLRTTNASGVTTILDKRQASPIQGYCVFLNDGFPGLQLATDGEYTSWILHAAVAPEAFVADGSWHMIAISIDRDDPQGVIFYVDGQQAGSPSSPLGRSGSLDSSADLVIGRQHDVGYGVDWYDGDLDEIEIFRRALTDTEVLAIYDASTHGKCREAALLPDRISACAGESVTTSFTVCNYDDVPHIYGWQLRPLSVGCDEAVENFDPESGWVTVAGGDCVTVDVTLQVPSGLTQFGTACFDISVFNHDTGRIFGDTGYIKEPETWCNDWWDVTTKIPGILPVHYKYGNKPSIIIDPVGPMTPGTMFDYDLTPVCAEDETIPSGNVILNGLAPGQPDSGSVPVPQDGSDIVIPIEIDLAEHMVLGFDKILLRADDDGDGDREVIGELLIRSTLQIPSAAGDEPPNLPPLRTFRSAPNPFNPQTAISFELTGNGSRPVDLRVFDVRGRLVRTIYSHRMLGPGVHTVHWTGDDQQGRKLGSGVYLIQIVTPQVTDTVKAVLIK